MLGEDSISTKMHVLAVLCVSFQRSALSLRVIMVRDIQVAMYHTADYRLALCKCQQRLVAGAQVGFGFVCVRTRK